MREEEVGEVKVGEVMGMRRGGGGGGRGDGG